MQPGALDGLSCYDTSEMNCFFRVLDKAIIHRESLWGLLASQKAEPGEYFVYSTILNRTGLGEKEPPTMREWQAVGEPTTELLQTLAQMAPVFLRNSRWIESQMLAGEELQPTGSPPWNHRTYEQTLICRGEETGSHSREWERGALLFQAREFYER